MPSRPLLKLPGPGRHGQKRGHPQVSVHLRGVTPELWDRQMAGGRGLGASPECLVDTLGQRETPMSQTSSEPDAPRSAEPILLAPPGSGEPPAAPGARAGPRPHVLAGMHMPVSSRASSSEPPTAKTCSLFLPNYVQDKYLLQLLRSADDVSTWVAAEIVTSHTSKVGARLTGGPGCRRKGAAPRGGPQSSVLRARSQTPPEQG